MSLFDELEKEMKDIEQEVVEVSAEPQPLHTQITVWVFSVCLIALFIAGTVKLIMWMF